MDYAGTKEIIHQTNMLSEDDAAFIDNNIADIQANWEKRQIFRTETEARISVLNDTKFPNPAAKYWQCIREQSVFYEQLVIESFSYRRNDLKIEKIQLKINECTSDLKRRGLEIDLEEAQFGKLNIVATAKDRMRELRLWAKLIDECVAADPDFDSENVDTHQFVSYMMRWHLQLKGLDQSNSSISEVNNLTGQYITALRAAHDKKVILPQVIQQDAKELGVPVYTAPPLSLDARQTSVIMDIGSVKFKLDGTASGIQGS
jgi:hypothetical protein